jgi:hypothetical protein
MGKKNIACVAIGGPVAIGAVRKPPHIRHLGLGDNAARYIKGKFAGGVRVISLLVSLTAAEH